MGRSSNGWIIFKGLDSRDLNVNVKAPPVIPHPAPRGTFHVVPGRDGELWEPDGTYERIEIKISLETTPDTVWSEFARWLTGSGDLQIYTDPDHVYKATVTGKFDSSRFLPGNPSMRQEVTFSADPYRYQADPEELTLTAAAVLTNPGTALALPKFQISGSGAGTLAVGDVSLTLDNITSPVTIDCDAKFAYSVIGGVAITLNDEEWPVLNLSTTSIAWTGGITQVKVWPNWRWI